MNHSNRNSPLCLAADIGGSKTVIGLFRKTESGFETVRKKKCLSRTITDVGEWLRTFLEDKQSEIDSACIAAAGPVTGGSCRLTNLPLEISVDTLKSLLGTESVVLKNDLEAAALRIETLNHRDLIDVNPGGVAKEPGHRCLLAAGTGLGEALIFSNDREYIPFRTEGGHTDFAPRDDLEIGLLKFLAERFGRVSYERILSGPGLVNLFGYLIRSGNFPREPEIENEIAKENSGLRISQLALSDRSRLCRKTLDIFFSILGAEAGNLALKGMSLGGVYLAGPVIAGNLEFLKAGRFLESFYGKGRFSSLMHSIPVHVVLDEEIVLNGACLQAYQLLSPSASR